MILFKNSNIRAQAGGNGFADRAARGARFLDERAPGWESQINLDTLNIARSDNCALGQVYGSYGVGVQATGTAARVHDLGFMTAGSIDEEYRLLTEAWKKEVQDRRALVSV